tara:strand:- start:5592 stop:6362 length:771 start_codon:yes stop_codon:yes gene_type:complete
MNNENKIIWIDIGTHNAQEYKSIFSTDLHFYWKIFRRLVGSKLLKRGNFLKLTDISKLNSYRKYLKNNKSFFHFTFIEANYKILNSSIYNHAHDVFCFAIVSDKKNHLKIGKLYYADDDETSQGNSIYKNKGNINIDNFNSCILIDADKFSEYYKKFLDEKFKSYEIILRINCEGSEDDVIYAMHKTFKNKLKLIFGSLKDVKGVKGDKEYINLENYMRKNKLRFIDFSPSVHTWLNSFSALDFHLKKINSKTTLI